MVGRGIVGRGRVGRGTVHLGVGQGATVIPGTTVVGTNTVGTSTVGTTAVGTTTVGCGCRVVPAAGGRVAVRVGRTVRAAAGGAAMIGVADGDAVAEAVKLGAMARGDGVAPGVTTISSCPSWGAVTRLAEASRSRAAASCRLAWASASSVRPINVFS